MVEEKRLALTAVETEPAKEAVQTEMATGRALLMGRLEPERLPVYLSVAKGRGLVGRFMGIASREEATLLIASILRLAPIIIRRDKDSGGRGLVTALLPGILEAAKRLTKEQLAELLGLLTKNYVRLAAEAKSRLGLCLPLILLCHASRRRLSEERLSAETEGAILVWLDLFPALAANDKDPWPLPWLRPEHIATLSAWLQTNMHIDAEPIASTLAKISGPSLL